MSGGECSEWKSRRRFCREAEQSRARDGCLMHSVKGGGNNALRLSLLEAETPSEGGGIRIAYRGGAAIAECQSVVNTADRRVRSCARVPANESQPAALLKLGDVQLLVTTPEAGLQCSLGVSSSFAKALQRSILPQERCRVNESVDATAIVNFATQSLGDDVTV